MNDGRNSGLGGGGGGFSSVSLGSTLELLAGGGGDGSVGNVAGTRPGGGAGGSGGQTGTDGGVGGSLPDQGGTIGGGGGNAGGDTNPGQGGAAGTITGSCSSGTAKPGFQGQSGSADQGGNGITGGGGGGGHGGGGGGTGASCNGADSAGGGGGGGGSSYAAVSGAHFSTGAQSGNGKVQISYVVDGDLAIAQPANITVDATGSSGVTVTYPAPAVTDTDDASPPTATCTPKSGSVFPIGTTTVTCTATDSDDTPSTVSTSFTVTVKDTDLAIAQPGDITVDATGPSGATVTYPAPVVTDPDDASPPAATCTPASGSVFAIGTTTVHCSATDSDDTPSTVSASFTVMVKGAAAQLADLYQAVRGTGLASTVAAAQQEVAAGQPQLACVMLRVFLVGVEAEVPFAIGPGAAAVLVADATRIRAVLGCGNSLF